MADKIKEPKTLQEAIVMFSNPDTCLKYLAAKRWPDGIIPCPVCGRTDVTFLPTQRKWQCKSRHHHRQFSVKVGSIYEDSPLGLDKWLTATWMLATCKNGISSHEMARDLGVTQKTAWFMLHRIRKAMQTGSFQRKLSGHVEVDETFIGGKARFMHKSKRAKVFKRGPSGKTIVVGVLQRGGRVHAEVVDNRERESVQSVVKENVEKGLELSTDEWSAYFGLSPEYTHKIINHADAYVDGQVHTNGLENFWSLLKRGLKGTYVSVDRSIFSVTLTNKCSATTIVQPKSNLFLTLTASAWSLPTLPERDSRTKNSLARAWRNPTPKCRSKKFQKPLQNRGKRRVRWLS